MYKVALLLAIICILPLSAIGGSLHYGAKTGVTLANQDFDYAEFGSPDFHTRTGWNIGFFTEWQFVSALSLAIGLHYVQKGTTVKVSSQSEHRPPTGPGTAITSFSSRIDYLSLPLFAKTTISLGRVRSYFFVGPRLDIKVGHKATMGFDVLYDEFKSSVFGGTVGVGQVLPVFSSVAAVIELYYLYDFTDAYETDLLVVKNRAWGILVGIQL